MSEHQNDFYEIWCMDCEYHREHPIHRPHLGSRIDDLEKELTTFRSLLQTTEAETARLRLVCCEYHDRARAAEAKCQTTEAERDEARKAAEQWRWQLATAKAEIDAAWFGIDHGYDIETRAELEADARTNGFKFGLAQAVHHIWKREPRVAELESRLTSLTQAQHRLMKLAKEATNGWACYAKGKLEHDEIARLHREIDALADGATVDQARG